MSNSPGTVSKILWHFTGGPIWNSKTNKQGKRLKPAAEGYKALKAILNSKVLKTGDYHEVVKTIIPYKRIFNLKKRDFEIKKNVRATIKSKPVCCVADIPIQHLSYHSNRYGKIAIGFHRNSVVSSGFNPVLYTLENSILSKQIHDGHSQIANFDASWAAMSVDDIQSDIEKILDEHEIDEEVDTNDAISAIEDLESDAALMLSYYENLLAYIKTFDNSEFESIYCEREWRSTNDFMFKAEDVAMIVLPKKGKVNYLNKFIKYSKLPRTIPIVSWEDLIEH